jgi:hypothetical protein
MCAPAVTGGAFPNLWHRGKYGGRLFRRQAHYKAIIPDALEVRKRDFRPQFYKSLLRYSIRPTPTIDQDMPARLHCIFHPVVRHLRFPLKN